MKKLGLLGLILILVFSYVVTSQAEDYKEGVDYDRVKDQQTSSGDQVEVLEFFWYGCPHCLVFDPFLHKWVESKPANVEFSRIPVVFRPEWKAHARTYYALQVIGEGERLHADIFNEIQKKRNRLETEDSIYKFVASKNVNVDDFKQAYKSFAVDGMVRKSIGQLKDYNIAGVPAMTVNGKYLITGEKAKSYENMVKIVDFLVKKETAADAHRAENKR